MEEKGFLEKLKEKKDEKQLEKAKEFIEFVKPNLIQAAEEGYGGYRYRIAKDSLQLYSNKTFINYLNDNLEGVKVEYKAIFQESILVRGRGYYEHELHFTW